MKTAILQCADTGPVESLMVMLESVGYQCWEPSYALRARLQSLGCDNVLSSAQLMKRQGYARPKQMPSASLEMMKRIDLYVDIKAHRNGPKIWAKWPNLKTKTLWYRINGGEPQDIAGHGIEIAPPCPILTPNLWYRDPGPWDERGAYSCWPPFYRANDYFPVHGRPESNYHVPICLVHNLKGWGYGPLIDDFRIKLKVETHGAWSPAGVIQHTTIAERLARAICMVHMKSNDAPGYAMLECLAAACPLVLTRRMIWRCKMDDMFEPGVNCLVYDRIGHQGLTDDDVVECTREVGTHLEMLKDPVENKRIGEAGRQRLLDIMWDVKKDQKSLAKFMEKCYGV